jgi:hypothetical protein
MIARAHSDCVQTGLCNTIRPFPGFPVEFVGVDELHAAFLNESRTRGRCLVRAQEIRVKSGD